MSDASQEKTFEQAVVDLLPPLRSYLRRYVGDRMLADDLLQETLLGISRGLPGFRAQASMKTWAFAIATRVAADHFRSPAQRVRIVAIDDSDEAGELPAGERPADERMVVGEMSACIHEVIDSLPGEYRAALLLHDLEDLGAAQVAEICGCSLATAKIRIHRARKRLKDALSGQCRFYRDTDDVFRCDRKPAA